MRWLAAAALGLALAFLLLPIAALLTDQPPRAVVAALGRPGAVDALLLSAQTASAALALIVVVGTPAGWLLATRRFPGRAVVLTLVELPLVLPPAVAGVALLVAFTPAALTTTAVVLALTFVAGPYYLRQAVAAFEAVDRDQLEVARTLGAGEAGAFARVGVPAAASGLAAGAALALGRALGEFGATLVFAGSLQGVTQTAPLAIYGLLGVDPEASIALSCVLVALSATLLLGMKTGAGDRRP